jgi:hypothetical protein
VLGIYGLIVAVFITQKVKKMGIIFANHSHNSMQVVVVGLASY